MGFAKEGHYNRKKKWISGQMSLFHVSIKLIQGVNIKLFV